MHFQRFDWLRDHWIGLSHFTMLDKYDRLNYLLVFVCQIKSARSINIHIRFNKRIIDPLLLITK